MSSNSNPLISDLIIFSFENYCLKLITMDDYMQLFVPK